MGSPSVAFSMISFAQEQLLSRVFSPYYLSRGYCSSTTGTTPAQLNGFAVTTHTHTHPFPVNFTCGDTIPILHNNPQM